MASIATGSRLKSTVCSTEIMVVKAPAGDIDLTCGGAPLGPVGSAAAGAPHADHATGCAIGKRYVDESGDLELLCVKAGPGSLAVGGSPLTVKGAKKLPSSD